MRLTEQYQPQQSEGGGREKQLEGLFLFFFCFFPEKENSHV